MFSTSVLIGSLFFAAHVSGLAARSPFEPSLVARQTNPLPLGSIPTTCQPRCASIGMALSEDPAGSSCTNGNGAALKKCVQCMVALDSSTAVMTQMQGILDHFVANCAGSVSPIRVDAPSSTASPSATVPSSAGATSSGSTTGLGTSLSASSTATGTAGSKGSVNQSNSPSAAGRATVGSVGLVGLAMGVAVLLL